MHIYDESEFPAAAFETVGEVSGVASVETVSEVSRRRRLDETDEDNELTGTGWLLAPGAVVTSYQLVQDRSEFSLNLRYHGCGRSRGDG